jgi:hypothetical protein
VGARAWRAQTYPQTTGKATWVAPPLSRFEWERLIRELELSSAQKVTAYAMATYVNGDGSNAHPGIALLMKATGLSRRSVISALSGLESEGFIVAVSRGGGKGVTRGNATIYALSVPSDGGRHRREGEVP